MRLQHGIMTLIVSLGLMNLLVACDPEGIEVQDSLDFDLFDSELHTPYVEGEDMNLSVRRQDNGSVSGWSLRSDDGAVFEISSAWADDAGETLRARAVALAPGLTELRVLDAKGRTRAARSIRVERPDSIQMLPAGLSRVRPELAPRLDLSDSISVLSGGTATFEVAYYRDEERLFGNGVLSFGEDPPVPASNERTYLFRDREWLLVEAVDMGVFSLPLLVNGQVLGYMQVRSVDESAIASIEIVAEEIEGAEEGDMFYLLARAFDATDVEIFGIAFDWEVEGEHQAGAGDLYHYSYSEGAWVDVSANAGEAFDTVSVQMDGGYVTSSHNIGCATAPGTSTGLGFLAMLAMLVFRPRRQQVV